MQDSTPHMKCERGEVIVVGVHVCGLKQFFNRNLAIDSPQTFAVELLVEFIDLALPLRAPEMLSSLSKSRISLFNVHLALFVRRVTQLQLHYPIGKYHHLVN